ncbi:hypothetical protein BKA61DRAFT_669094 [Leptodontidium sp. MPI-SDFR-AT-0119]|nr:hypothetical protein BKA61DRAFT_669094 [Leptodontidium sp. MPI-SDFR-AT-0119]
MAQCPAHFWIDSLATAHTSNYQFYYVSMRFYLAFSSLISSVLAASRTSDPSGAITVGSGGSYSTIQAAIKLGMLNSLRGGLVG